MSEVEFNPLGPDSGVQRALSQVPGWDAAGDAAEAGCKVLGGGITNQNYLLTVSSERYVLRIGGENTELLGIRRENEHRASRIAAELGLGAEIVAFVPEERALVTRFVAGESVSAVEAAVPKTLSRIVDGIRSYHAGPAFSGTFSPFETVRTYRQLAAERGVGLPPNAADALSRAAEIEAALGPLERPVPCHNDLLPGNFIDDGKRIRILDWEYAAMGDPFFDLGNLAANLELDAQGCELLVRSYCRRVESQHLARLRLMVLASDLRESFWGFLQSGISSLDFDFRAYAVKHLDRFNERSSASEVGGWLADVGSASSGI